MTTAEESKDISDAVYSVDPLWPGPTSTKGSRFTAGSGADETLYEVVDLENNPVNGFQAMAVAPVVNGHADTSRIVVAYAGTNPDHRADIIADVESAVGGEQGPGTQIMDAKVFAKRVRQAHPGASMSTAGHSLGAWLAMVVGAENRWPATTFNGPDPWAALSPEAKAWVRAEQAAGRDPLHNYVNVWDLVGNLYANSSGATDHVADRTGRPPFDYHNIGKGKGFTVNPDGSIKGAGAKARTLEEIIANSLAGSSPGVAEALAPALGGLVAALRSPAFMKTLAQNVSGLIVAVNTVSTLALAASIGGTTTALAEIKLANGRLIPHMRDGLLAAQNAASTLPYITTYDIESCVEVNRLHVHQNIDEDAVNEVDRLVDSQIARVTQIAEGISRSVIHTVEQDAQWALTYGAR
jgi:hypothetical protein